MMQIPGATTPFSGLAIWAGGSTRLSIRVARSSHVFLAAGADYQLRQAGPLRPAAARARRTAGSVRRRSGWKEASGWRSSFLVGLAFTLAGRPLMTD